MENNMKRALAEKDSQLEVLEQQNVDVFFLILLPFQMK
jgi:hypothetical protein